jgi:hypothetical protein
MVIVPSERPRASCERSGLKVSDPMGLGSAGRARRTGGRPTYLLEEGKPIAELVQSYEGKGLYRRVHEMHHTPSVHCMHPTRAPISCAGPIRR